MTRGILSGLRVAIASTALALSGCAAVVVESQTVSAAEASAARTYYFLGGRSLQGDLLADEKLRADLDAMVRRGLSAVGLQPAANAREADVLIQYWVNLDVEGKASRPAGQVDDSGGPGVVPMSPPMVGLPGPEGLNSEKAPLLMASYREGLLVLDLLGPQTRNLLWRGTVRLDVRKDRERSLAELEGGLSRSLRSLPRR